MSLQKKFIKSKKVCKVTFALPEDAAQGAKEVKLLGDFNSWKKPTGVPMKLTDGHFKTSIELPIGQEYQFRYLFDNKQWGNDHAADKYVPTPYGVDNSVVVAMEKKATK
ncbi:MAG: 1,4-alpha-glucan branching enzyme [Salibacteraceae bacterium]|jgi:1,4-alpha-glucan branching enzyme